MGRAPIIEDRYYADRTNPLIIVRPWSVEPRAVHLDVIHRMHRDQAPDDTMGKSAFRAQFKLITPEPPCDPARYYTVDLCQCCMVMLANGDGCQCGDDTRQHPAGLMGNLVDEEITLGALAEEHDSKCPVNVYGSHSPLPGEFECDCETDTFSGVPCDGCGTHLAGERRKATGWVKAPAE
jgi:hypothetical protein